MSPEVQNPDSLPHDIHYIKAQSFPERIRLVCRAWILQENATPVPVYFGYIFKIALFFVGGWWFFCSFSSTTTSIANFGSWAMTPVAFQKAVLWALTYESLGLGCSTGPMTGRFIPPIGGCLYFLRPGTIKLPYPAHWKILGGSTRTWVDVGLYAAIHLFAFRALMSEAITPGILFPIVVLLPLAGLRDKTVFLSARGEHYYTALVCCWYMNVAGGVWIAGSKMIWVAIWFWAATSKLNNHFPGVICVMLTNSPLIPEWFHKKLFRQYPDDMRPSNLARVIAHSGTLVEYAFPMVLLASGGGSATPYALAMMVAFHCFIAFNFPMGMPVEWNVMMVYGAFFLFGTAAAVPVATIMTTPVLMVFLLVLLVAIPLYGNFFPAGVSFLMSMRYYAGNWAYSVWLFKNGDQSKLDVLNKPTQPLREQLTRIIDDPDVVEMAMVMQPSFRLVHLQGRVMHDALPHAVDNIDDYEWCEGEMIAGMVVGWNFGDGHLHDEQLIETIQERCGFEPGELRIVIVESQPLAGATQAWRVLDPATGPIASGESKLSEMVERHPWPTGALAEPYARGGGEA